MTPSIRPHSLVTITPILLLCMGIFWAIDPAGAESPEPRADQPLQLRCRVFTALLDPESTLDTQDATTEIGQWIAEQEGWTLHAVDFEIGQKSTGFPQAYRHVCLSPAG